MTKVFQNDFVILFEIRENISEVFVYVYTTHCIYFYITATTCGTIKLKIFFTVLLEVNNIYMAQ